MARSDRNTYGNHIVVDLTGFGEAMNSILSDMQENMREALNKGVKLTAKETAKETRDVGTYRNRRPRYRKSISYRFSTKGYIAEAQIYARGHEYSLTHLLEKGHRIGHTSARTRKYPHWKIGEEYAKSVIDENIFKYLKF